VRFLVRHAALRLHSGRTNLTAWLINRPSRPHTLAPTPRAASRAALNSELASGKASLFRQWSTQRQLRSSAAYTKDRVDLGHVARSPCRLPASFKVQATGWKTQACFERRAVLGCWSGRRWPGQILDGPFVGRVNNQEYSHRRRPFWH